MPTPARADRRTLLRAAAGAAALALAPTRAGGAARGWCKSDPLIAIDGGLADIFIAAPLKILLAVTGPTEFVVTLPEGVDGVLLLGGVGFGRGETLRFETSRKLARTPDGIEVKVAARVPARNDLPIAVEFAPRILGILAPDTAEGETNRWVRLATTF